MKEKISNSCGIHSFGTRDENYSLTRAIVNHDHDRVGTGDGGKVSNEVHREVLERVRFFEYEGGDGQDHRMGEHLVCLTDCAARDIFLDIDRMT